MVARGNPLNIRKFSDIAKEGVRYVNRQKGSGTRILTDYLCKQENLDASAIYGYDREELTHTSVAAQIVSGSADAGMGIYSAAKLYDRHSRNYKNDNLLDAALLWKCGGSKCDSLYQVARTLNYFHDEEERIAFKEMSDHYEVFYKMYLADISNNNIGKATIFLRDQLKFIWDIADLLV